MSRNLFEGAPGASNEWWLINALM